MNQFAHYYRGGCDGGDEVADTPAENEPAYNCEVGRDTCPTLPGLDVRHSASRRLSYGKENLRLTKLLFFLRAARNQFHGLLVRCLLD